MTAKAELQAEVAEIERRTSGLLDDAAERRTRNAAARLLDPVPTSVPTMSSREMAALARAAGRDAAVSQFPAVAEAIGRAIAAERQHHKREIDSLRSEVEALRRQLEALTERAPLRLAG
jgi:molecular chaperone GrpE (heat shock protein)